jgi:hypothetical protein
MGEIRIRNARPADAAPIAAANAEGVPGVTPFEAHHVASMIDAATLFLVAEVGGDVAAYLMAYAPGTAYDGEEYLWFSGRGEDFLYVDQIAVTARARGSGVGRALYDEAAREARQRSLSALVCEVNIEPPNPRSMGFHRRLGFTEVGRLRVRLHDRYVALMRKPL